VPALPIVAVNRGGKYPEFQRDWCGGGCVVLLACV
jgi:hypothetical protein